MAGPTLFRVEIDALKAEAGTITDEEVTKEVACSLIILILGEACRFCLTGS